MKFLSLLAVAFSLVFTSNIASACTPPGNCGGQGQQSCSAAYAAYNACMSAKKNKSSNDYYRKNTGQTSSPSGSTYRDGARVVRE